MKIIFIFFIVVDLGGIPLGELESQLLATVASKLVTLELNFTWLTTQQIGTWTILMHLEK